MRGLLYGQAPSRTSVPGEGPPLSGPSGRRLIALAGLRDYSELAELFEVRNLVDDYPGRGGKGDRFPAARGRAIASRERICWHRGQIVVLLGRAVQQAFGYGGAPPLERVALGGAEAEVYLIPHPSGVNLWYNDPANRKAAGDLLREIVRRLR